MSRNTGIGFAFPIRVCYCFLPPLFVIRARTGITMKLSALLLVFLLLLSQSCYGAKSGQEFMLLYSNDVHGETEACG